MSIDYTLYISTVKSPVQIMERIGALANVDDLISPDEPGLTTHAASVDHPITRADIEETYGFVPTVMIIFTLDKFHEDLPGLQARLAKSVMALLGKEDGDAALVFDGGAPILKRTGDDLSLNENWSHWKSEALEGLALDYRFTAL